MKQSMRLALLLAIAAAACLHITAGAQGAGQNVNVITGSDDQFTGDQFRQRQNESVIGISSVNTSNMIVAYNDYRVVDRQDDFGVGTLSPGQSFVSRVAAFFKAPWRLWRREPERPLKTAAFAWVGLSFSNNGGKSWYSGLLPGRYSPVPPGTDPRWADTFRLAEFDAASDPVMATTPDQFFLAGIAFNPPPNPADPGGPTDGDGRSIGWISRFTDNNDSEKAQTMRFDGLKVLIETDSAARFVDKPSVAASADGRVYVSFVVFDQSDPEKLSSKILFFHSSDFGNTFAGPITLSDPLTRNQSPWIVVDPKNSQTVYVGWRVFSARSGGWSNAIVGKKSTNGGQSFTTRYPWPVAPLLKAFDAPQGNISSGTPPSPRSNAYPTAAIDGDGAIHVAIQEYVYPPTHPEAQLRGRPLRPSVSPTHGVPRITVTTSYNGGVSWTPRRAADLGTAASPAGTQFMPVLAAAGEPGPSCPGQTGPRSRVMLMYYDARAGGAGLVPGGTGYLVGGGVQFDVRMAQASACSTNGLTFSPSEQVSQYTRSAEPPFDIVNSENVNFAAVNRTFTNFCGGYCTFTGDYIHMLPRVPYVQTAAGTWKLTTAVDAVDRDALPAPVVQAVWTDSRNVAVPFVEDPSNPRLNLPAGSTALDALPWHIYQPPGTGTVSCLNPGSRDQNIYTAEYTPGGLFASAPATFRTSTFPRSYPIYVENRTPFTKHYLLTIEAAANASFDYTVYESGNTQEPVRMARIAIGPISSVTGTVVVGPGVTTPIVITVAETTAAGDVIAPPAGAKTAVTLFTAGMDTSESETYQPAIFPTPVVTKPFALLLENGPIELPRSPAVIPSPTPFAPNPVEPNPFAPNPFAPNPFAPNPFAPNPFAPNPFAPNPFAPNPFAPNPFAPHPFAPNVTVYDVTDVSYVVRNQGEQTAAFNAIANVNSTGDTKVYQLLLNRAVPTPILIRNADGTCRAADSWQAVPISTIVNPFAPNPFAPNPFAPNAQPLERSNASFYVKPSSETAGAQAFSALNSGPSYVAEPKDDVMVITVREFLLAPPDPGDPETLPLDPDDVEIEVTAHVPEQLEGGVFEEDPPSAGTRLPDHLAFTQQPPANVTAGIPLPPVQVTVNDAFGNAIGGNVSPGNGPPRNETPAIPVTISLGNNPTGATLTGTLTKLAIDGVATFTDLVIDKVGTGFTLFAEAVGLKPATSTPFNVIADPLTITTQAVPDATLGQAYDQKVFAKGGLQPYVWDIVPLENPNPEGEPFTLPDGLQLTSGEDGVGRIQGTPTTEFQVRSFRLRVTDASGQVATQDLCIHVLESPLGTLTTTVATPLAVAQTLVGEGVSIIESSVKFKGNALALGTFTGGFGATGLGRGIVLASGHIANIQPPNNGDGVGTSFNGAGDADLQALIPGFITRDAAILEFDFEVTDPNATIVKFEYVFASEEYNEYVNSSFNDVFGFFLSGPNFPKKNLAIVPGTASTPVSIDTVNLGVNAGFFVNNDFGDLAPGPYLGTQADGLTRVLTLQAEVVPSTEGKPVIYHMKIAIADAGDTVFDSFVLLRAQSLSAICPLVPNGPTNGQ